MRLKEITKVKTALSGSVQTFSPQDISDNIVDVFHLRPRGSFRRSLVRQLAPILLRLQQKKVHKLLQDVLPFKCNLVSYGERFAHDASLSALLKLTRSEPLKRVLVPGCYLADEDVQFWLRREIDVLEGVDVYSLEKRWSSILPRLADCFKARISFRQASIESLPYENNSFDLIVSSAVLEHVRNLDLMARETARVLRPGGWAWHDFGPLYFTCGGDHCISAYGEGSGYDHLLLDDEEYVRRINDQSFFDRQQDPNLPFWARRQQFSFAFASEYLLHLNKYFEIKHLIVKLSEEGLSFRDGYSHKWRQLLDAGLTDADLLIKSLSVVLQKRR